MAKQFPEISESAEWLRQAMEGEKHKLKRKRLHTLYLIKSGQVQSRVQIGRLLGARATTVGQWVSCYAAEGLAGLVRVKPVRGREATLSAEQQAALRTALSTEMGFGSYGEIQEWLVAQFGMQMSYSAVHKLVRYRLKARLKVVRPTHPKKTQVPLRPSVRA